MQFREVKMGNLKGVENYGRFKQGINYIFNKIFKGNERERMEER